MSFCRYIYRCVGVYVKVCVVVYVCIAMAGDDTDRCDVHTSARYLLP